MTSKAEAIAAAVHAKLSTLSTVPAARVYRDLHGALAAKALPAIAVETGDEAEPQRLVIGHVMRTTEIRVVVLAAGASPFTAADPIVVEVFDKLAADRTLGGLAFEFAEGMTLRAREDTEQNLVSVTKLLQYQYRTTESSLE